MNLGSLKLNPGAQTEFVLGDEKFSAFIGGLGSGKTYAGILRGLKFALQPKPHGIYHPPHGLIAAASYRALDDVIVTKLQEICAVTGVADFEKDFKKSTNTLTLRNGAIIRLRSLDKPDNIIRGPEYSWAFIDEGRNVSLQDWKLVTGRLRQPGYKRGAWVASTPNGYDWMHRVFHDEGDLHSTEYKDSHWYNAPMRENIHLDSDYLDEMDVSYSGRWHEQEVLGHFIGLVEGGVFPEWDDKRFCVPLQYRRELPVYTCWDFGIGDPGVCVFFQLDWKVVDLKERSILLPSISVIDMIEGKDMSSKEWADAYHAWVEAELPEGVVPRGNYGDPAGEQRRVGMKTSVIEDLRAAGVNIMAAPRKPQDYAIRILSNMMADGRVLVDSQRTKRVSNALGTHKWKLDKDGIRTGDTPVHDWTSHIVDALRYGVSMIPLRPREGDEPPKETPGPRTYGHVIEQLMAPADPRRGRRRPTFEPGPIGGGQLVSRRPRDDLHRGRDARFRPQES